MSGGDEFTNIRRGAAEFHTSHAPTKQDRPSSSSTAATESSGSSSSEPPAPAPRLPAWKLREAAKRSGSPPRRASSDLQRLKPKITMEIGTSTPSGHGRRKHNLSVINPPYPMPRGTAGPAHARMALPYLNDSPQQHDEASVRSARSSARSHHQSEVQSARAASREPSSRGRRSTSKERNSSSEAATRSSSVSRRHTRSSSQERRATRSSSKERRSTRSSSRDPSRRATSREPRRHVRSSSQEPSRRAASRERIASHSAVAEGSTRRRGMRKSDLVQQEGTQEEPQPEIARESIATNEKKESTFASPGLPPRSPVKQKTTKVVIESCQDSFDFGGFPSTYSFDNDDPFKSSFNVNKIKEEPVIVAASAASPPPLTKKPSKTSASVLSRKSSPTSGAENDDVSSVPSMFQAAMDYGKKTKRKSKKTTSKSKKSSSEADPAKQSSKSKKKKKTKTSEPDTPATIKTKKTKKSTTKTKITKKEEAPKNDDGFDWEVPVTPVFETPSSKAPKKKLSSKEDINELCKRDKDSTDAFHNSLDNLFELPAGLMSPIGKKEVNEKDQPVIHIPDDASHASDVSSICDISERSEEEDILEPQTPRTQRRGVSGNRSLRSHRSHRTATSHETSNTRSSAATTATAWQLREQQKHARRPGGRRGMSMQAPQTVPSRPRRAMTTHLKHQQCPLPPAFAALSAPSTPKTPALNRRLMTNKERGLQDRISKDRKESIAGSLLYCSGDNDDASIEPDLLSTCSRSVYSQRNQNLQKFNNPSTNNQQIAIPQNAKLEIDPFTGKQQLVVELGDVPAAFRTSMKSLQSTRSKRRD